MLAELLPWQTFLLTGAIGTLIGWLFLHLSRRQDRKSWIYERAPSLPVGVLAEHDDAWIRGIVCCEAPLRCPWFEVNCAAYEYEIERKETETYEDSDGTTKTRTTWTTDHSDSQVIDFLLLDGADEILVRATQGRVASLESCGTEYETESRRHTASVLPVGARVSTLGVRLEDGSFGPLQEIPLLVTEKTREEFVSSSLSTETVLRVVGMVLVFLGWGGGWLLSRGTVDGPGPWLGAVGLGLAALTPIWFTSTYNRLVRLRQQRQASWRQIDVDLAVRAGLVPQLTAVLEGYGKHEKDLQTDLAALRSGGGQDDQVRSERRAVAATRRVLALVESYPDLKANQLFLDLHERLWALEEKLASSRTLYDRIVKEWNNANEGFPSLIVARLFGMQRAPHFAIPDEERIAPSAGQARSAEAPRGRAPRSQASP